MNILHIMRGLPGSGKSTTAHNLALALKPYAIVCSTDDYWLRPDGRYDFNYDLVAVAHKWNQNRVDACMQMLKPHVIVDNVNTTWKEIQPYVRLAYLYEYAVQLHESDAPWAMNVEECYKLNRHGVPYSTILRMYNEWENTADIRINIEQYEVKNA